MALSFKLLFMFIRRTINACEFRYLPEQTGNFEPAKELIFND